AVAVDVGPVPGAAVADLLEPAVAAAPVAGVPAPAPDAVGVQAVERRALGRHAGLAAHPCLGPVDEEGGDGGTAADEHRGPSQPAQERAPRLAAGQPATGPLDCRVQAHDPPSPCPPAGVSASAMSSSTCSRLLAMPRPRTIPPRSTATT